MQPKKQIVKVECKKKKGELVNAVEYETMGGQTIGFDVQQHKSWDMSVFTIFNQKSDLILYVATIGNTLYIDVDGQKLKFQMDELREV